MQERQRRHESEGEGGGGNSPTGAGNGGSLNRLRQAGADFLAAGDDAISRALSGDSEKFLAANRQQGGE